MLTSLGSEGRTIVVSDNAKPCRYMQVGENGSHIDSLTDALVDMSDVVLDVMVYRAIKKLTALKQRWVLLCLLRHFTGVITKI